AIPVLLGLMARRGDEAAFQFLRDHWDPAFWTSNPPWNFELGHHSAITLAGYCITGLALSGREEARKFLDSFLAVAPGNIDPNLATAVVTTAFE
ncbi:MAG TPA: hypothetical protein PLW35_09035, partial [Verrucomicrobiota bacterium]|nr:hypothetical protein [Verrucomicrobiota bacterium]